MKIAIGIDTGGTCTDAVVFDFDERKVIAKSKTLTTKENLSVGISKALDMLPQDMIRDAQLVSLSTTLATNACVENKGGRSGLVIFGMNDELMERLKVEETYGIKKGDVRCVDTHSAADGSKIDEPDWDELFCRIGDWVDESDYMAAAELYGPSIGAPCEKRFKAEIKERYGLDCVCANELTDKVNVIQRGATALLNARLLPLVQEFIDISMKDIRARGCSAPIMVVRSDGSFMSTDATSMKPVETILSGPAASILSGRLLSEDDSYIVVDMGGTTTDVSMVRGGLAANFTEGISIGSWKTSVDGVFVDTFALGGDSTVRCVKGKLQLFARRCIPLCTAASRFPQVNDQLSDVVRSGKFSKFPLYEFLYLMHEPRQRYNQEEMSLIAMLRDGPLSLYELSRRGVDLYTTDTSRLEDEGVLIRLGLTPTDFMHIKGDYTEFDVNASRLALEYIFNENRPAVTIPFDETAALKLCSEAYDIIEEKLYSNLVRIMLMQDYGRKLADGLGDKLEFVIKSSWDDYKECKAADGAAHCRNLNHPRFETDMQLLGVGAPTHVFLPAVAEALGTSCILPENAEIGNAIGAVMAELVVSSSVEISQWNDAGLYYIVHDENGSTRYESMSEASDHAIASATESAKREAVLRGAKGDLDVQIIRIGNSHEGGPTEKLLYGGKVTARIRFSLV